VSNPEVRSVTACFPCYNDAETIAAMVCDAQQALGPLVDELRIVVVDDGSSDGAPDVLLALAKQVPELTVILHERNRGYGGALISAFSAATTDWIFYTDGDLQYDATEAAALVKAVEPTTDIVQGYKIGRGDSWYRKVIGRTYHHLVKVAFNLHCRDTDCDFRLFRRSLIERTPLTSETGVICVEMMRKFERANAQFVEVPVHHYFRPHGRSQFFRLPHIARAGLQLGRLWFRLVVRHQPSDAGSVQPRLTANGPDPHVRTGPFNGQL
jgi:glycosyltransferase involved in cell wall biosynthesis